MENNLSLGEFLRQEREHRCITIEQVASATKVGVRTLHSLEEDHYAELPAKPFIRGFVTSYCRFIGLDPKEVLVRFEDFINKKASERPNREAGHSGYAFEKKDGDQQGRTVLLFAIVGFIMIGGLAMIFFKPSLRHHRSSHIDRLRQANTNSSPLNGLPIPVASVSTLNQKPDPNLANSFGVGLSSPSPSPGASASPSPGASETPQAALVPVALPTPTVEPTLTSTPSPSPSASPSVAPGENSPAASLGVNPEDPLDSGHALPAQEVHHRVTFQILADVWVRYQVDGRPIRKFIVRKGKTLVLRASEGIAFQVSNSKSVRYSYNGQGFGAPKEGLLFFPKELAEKTEKPFGDAKSLPQTEGPEADSESPTPTPSSEVIHTQ